MSKKFKKLLFSVLILIILMPLVTISLSGCGGGGGGSSGGGGGDSSSNSSSSPVIQLGNALECYVYVPASSGKTNTKDGDHKAAPPGYIALQGATVKVVGTGKSATTDSSGYSQIRDVSSGTYSIVISKEGYQALTYSNINVTSSSTTTVGDSTTGVQTQTSSNPAITDLSATSGLEGSSVTITGYNFGSTQDASTVNFNGTSAEVTGWSSTSIVCTVPITATNGNIVVNVGGNNSNGISFTVGITYGVTYNGNGNTGGTVPTDRNRYVQGATVTAQGNTGNLVKTGYIFAVWNTQADGNGTNYAVNSTLAMGSANVTLYAKWDPTYAVTYNGNSNTGGTAPSDSNRYAQGATVTALENTGSLVRTRYTFAGWNTAADGSGTDHAAGSTFAMGSSNMTLYAKWTLNPTYNITYNGNGNTGGAVPTDSNNYEQDDTVTVRGNTGSLVKTGYAFIVWNTQADGNGTNYAADSTFTMGSANVTLYAKWVPTYTVTYSGNGNSGGTAPTDSNRYAEGATVTVLDNTGNLVKTNYAFAGWNTQANGGGTSYAADSTFAMGSANVTLYAKWTANPTYTVTYNGNENVGGAAPTDNNRYAQGATMTVLGNTGNLTRTNYAFAGWNTQAGGSGTSYAANSTFAMGSANVTLYAKWNPTKSALITITKSDGSAVAVLMGVNYPAGYSLSYTAHDAVDLRDALTGSPLWAGATVTTQSNVDITKAMIQDAITTAKNNIANDGLFVFLYSGHGTSSGDTGFIVPYDGIGDESKRISEDELKSWLDAFNSNVKKYVLLDSCYGGSFIDKNLYLKSGLIPKVFITKDTNPYYPAEKFAKSLVGASNTYVMTASKGSEVCWETSLLQNGVFTYYVTQGLGTGATIGQASGNGTTITAEDLTTYVPPLVTAYETNQHPQSYDNYAGDLRIK